MAREKKKDAEQAAVSKHLLERESTHDSILDADWDVLLKLFKKYMPSGVLQEDFVNLFKRYIETEYPADKPENDVIHKAVEYFATRLAREKVDAMSALPSDHKLMHSEAIATLPVTRFSGSKTDQTVLPLILVFSLVYQAILDDACFPAGSLRAERLRGLCDAIKKVYLENPGICYTGMRHELVGLLNLTYTFAGEKQPVVFVEDTNSFILSCIKDKVREYLKTCKDKDPKKYYELMLLWVKHGEMPKEICDFLLHKKLDGSDVTIAQDYIQQQLMKLGLSPGPFKNKIKNNLARDVLYYLNIPVDPDDIFYEIRDIFAQPEKSDDVLRDQAFARFKTMIEETLSDPKKVAEAQLLAVLKQFLQLDKAFILCKKNRSLPIWQPGDKEALGKIFVNFYKRFQPVSSVEKDAKSERGLAALYAKIQGAEWSFSDDPSIGSWQKSESVDPPDKDIKSELGSVPLLFQAEKLESALEKMATYVREINRYLFDSHAGWIENFFRLYQVDSLDGRVEISDEAISEEGRYLYGDLALSEAKKNSIRAQLVKEEMDWRSSEKLKMQGNLYSQLFNLHLHNKIATSDKWLDQLYESAEQLSGTKIINVNPYQINRVILHAFVVSPKKWSESFTKVYGMVLDLLKSGRFESELTKQFVKDSFPEDLMMQLDFIAKLREREQLILRGEDPSVVVYPPQKKPFLMMFYYIEDVTDLHFLLQSCKESPQLKKFFEAGMEKSGAIQGMVGYDLLVEIYNNTKSEQIPLDYYLNFFIQNRDDFVKFLKELRLDSWRFCLNEIEKLKIFTLNDDLPKILALLPTEGHKELLLEYLGYEAIPFLKDPTYQAIVINAMINEKMDDLLGYPSDNGESEQIPLDYYLNFIIQNRDDFVKFLKKLRLDSWRFCLNKIEKLKIFTLNDDLPKILALLPTEGHKELLLQYLGYEAVPFLKDPTYQAICINAMTNEQIDDLLADPENSRFFASIKDPAKIITLLSIDKIKYVFEKMGIDKIAEKIKDFQKLLWVFDLLKISAVGNISDPLLEAMGSDKLRAIIPSNSWGFRGLLYCNHPKLNIYIEEIIRNSFAVIKNAEEFSVFLGALPTLEEQRILLEKLNLYRIDFKAFIRNGHDFILVLKAINPDLRKDFLQMLDDRLKDGLLNFQQFIIMRSLFPNDKQYTDFLDSRGMGMLKAAIQDEDQLFESLSDLMEREFRLDGVDVVMRAKRREALVACMDAKKLHTSIASPKGFAKILSQISSSACKSNFIDKVGSEKLKLIIVKSDDLIEVLEKQCLEQQCHIISKMKGQFKVVIQDDEQLLKVIGTLSQLEVYPNSLIHYIGCVEMLLSECECVCKRLNKAGMEALIGKIHAVNFPREVVELCREGLKASAAPVIASDSPILQKQSRKNKRDDSDHRHSVAGNKKPKLETESEDLVVLDYDMAWHGMT